MHRNSALINILFLAVCLCIAGAIAAPSIGKPVAPQAVTAASVKSSNKLKTQANAVIPAGQTATTAAGNQNGVEKSSQQSKDHSSKSVEEASSNEFVAAPAESTKKKGLAHTAELVNSALLEIFDALGNNKEKA